jgi:hypothetical protein
MYPGMTCSACEDIERVDGVEPDCRSGKCMIPPVPDGAEKAVRAWNIANGLRDLPALAGCLSAMGLSEFDLELVALIENERRSAAPGA